MSYGPDDIVDGLMEALDVAPIEQPNGEMDWDKVSDALWIALHKLRERD